jgi:hypothetical protein
MAGKTLIERGFRRRISGTRIKCIRRSRIGMVITIRDIILSVTCNLGKLGGKIGVTLLVKYFEILIITIKRINVEIETWILLSS